MKLKLLFGLLILTQTLFAQTFTEVSLDPDFDGVYYGSIAFSDVDSNNDQDVLITGLNSLGEQIAKLYTNDGTGNFTEMTGTPFVGVQLSSIAFTDVDGDNDQDVLITGQKDDSGNEPIAKLYTNDGTGNFIEMMGTPFDSILWGSIAFTDVDGDNDQDVLITGRKSSFERIAKLYTNDGTGNFTEMMPPPFEGVWLSSIAFSDVDGDNDQDILITGAKDPFDDEPITKLYTNDGTGNFTEMLDTPFDSVLYGSIAFADVDGDNDQDVLITGQKSIFERIAKLYINDGMGNFTEMLDTPFDDLRYSSIAFSDVDGDNDQDVLITGQNSSFMRIAKLYTNDGTGIFTEILDTPFDGVWQSSITFTDVDSDNDQDVLISGQNSSGEPIAKLYTNDMYVSANNDLILELKLNFTIYPNPTKPNILNVSFNSTENGFTTAKVYDLNGRLLKQQNEFVVMGQQTISIDIASLSSGSYFIQMNNNKRTGIVRFLVQ